MWRSGVQVVGVCTLHIQPTHQPLLKDGCHQVELAVALLLPSRVAVHNVSQVHLKAGAGGGGPVPALLTEGAEGQTRSKSSWWSVLWPAERFHVWLTTNASGGWVLRRSARAARSLSGTSRNACRRPSVFPSGRSAYWASASRPKEKRGESPAIRFCCFAGEGVLQQERRPGSAGGSSDYCHMLFGCIGVDLSNA